MYIHTEIKQNKQNKGIIFKNLNKEKNNKKK